LEERTEGAKPLDFNIFGATQRSANQVLMDFHLTEAVRTSRMVLNNVRKELQEKENDKDISILDAIESSFEKVLQNTLMNAQLQLNKLLLFSGILNIAERIC
jgi:hypothetical protein